MAVVGMRKINFPEFEADHVGKPKSKKKKTEPPKI